MWIAALDRLAHRGAVLQKLLARFCSIAPPPLPATASSLTRERHATSWREKSYKSMRKISFFYHGGVLERNQ
jgi:hypothetical protein